MDNTFVFNALPAAVLQWLDVVVDTYNKLNIRATKLEHSAASRSIYVGKICTQNALKLTMLCLFYIVSKNCTHAEGYI